MLEKEVKKKQSQLFVMILFIAFIFNAKQNLFLWNNFADLRGKINFPIPTVMFKMKNKMLHI